MVNSCFCLVNQIEALGKSARNQWEVAPYLLDNLLTMNLQPTTVTVNAAMTGYMVMQVEAGFYFIVFILPSLFWGGGVKRGIYTIEKNWQVPQKSIKNKDISQMIAYLASGGRSNPQRGNSFEPTTVFQVPFCFKERAMLLYG